jgi:hypothetical protein
MLVKITISIGGGALVHIRPVDDKKDLIRLLHRHAVDTGDGTHAKLLHGLARLLLGTVVSSAITSGGTSVSGSGLFNIIGLFEVRNVVVDFFNFGHGDGSHFGCGFVDSSGGGMKGEDCEER